ncbi:hypothetical protein GGH94_003307 [Coemansia aciculifera]|uniref:Mediator of RNA polymerase II transcription subunit 1 n=1 Tax=Coemansia aciculifera TaxID=417176 RepID=A0A9W8M4L1_9FUNG|nr:hypothetical protein GGH94_003307 [Coemansia aciculifera]KAJ2873466.1 hypothetical protein GGH93_003181 [Coemansia aciculifera]
MSNEAASALPYPQRTISDEFRSLQYIVSQFQTQLDAPHGTVGLHPFGPVNVDGAKTAFTQACKRLREALTSYRDTTLASWTHLLSAQGPPGNYDGMALTNKAPAAVRELDEMRRIADALHEDTKQCKMILLDAAASAISKALVSGPQQAMLVERLKSTAKRLELAHYTDTRMEGTETITTVTLAGSIIVIDVDIGDSSASLKVKVSYVSDIEHDERIDALMLDRLRAGDIRGFEELVEEMAVLDRLTRERSPASFIHNTFAIIATLKEIQVQELAALDGDSQLLLKYGSGIALPHARHVGPSSLYFMPATLRHGLAAEDWDKLVNGQAMSENVKSVSGLCHWLYYSWEPSSSPHCFLPAAIQKLCLSADAMEEGGSQVTVQHPAIHGLDMRFLEFKHGDMQDEFWIPYTLVARLEPALPACALTVRAIMAATTLVTQDEQPMVATAHDSPRLLENAPTLESLVRGNSAGTVEMEAPQIRAWTICRIPMHRPSNLLAVTAILRRQATFNSILASCFMDTVLSVNAKTYANDPFRIDLLVKPSLDTKGEQGLVLRVAETSDVHVWTHQALGISLDNLAGVATAALNRSTAHPALSKVAGISNSIPIIVLWLSTHPQ